MRKSYVLLLVIIGLFAAFYFIGSGDDVAQSGTIDRKSDASSVEKNDVAEPLQQEVKINPGNLRDAFEDSDDLYVLARTHFNSIDPEALWLVSKIVDYCAPFGMNPAGYVAQSETMLSLIKPESRRSAFKAAHDKVINRCRGFDDPQNKGLFDFKGDLVLKKRAAKAGSLPAEAALMSRGAPASMDSDYAKDLLRRVRLSRDPDAYLAISNAMGLSASGKENIFGKESGSNSSMYAWQLAACSIGLDCAAGSAIVTQYCSAGGICEPVSGLDSLIFNHLVTRAEEAEIRRMAAEIVNRTDG